jgi:hypothetical protein
MSADALKTLTWDAIYVGFSNHLSAHSTLLLRLPPGDAKDAALGRLTKLSEFQDYLTGEGQSGMSSSSLPDHPFTPRQAAELFQAAVSRLGNGHDPSRPNIFDAFFKHKALSSDASRMVVQTASALAASSSRGGGRSVVDNGSGGRSRVGGRASDGGGRVSTPTPSNSRSRSSTGKSSSSNNRSGGNGGGNGVGNSGGSSRTPIARVGKPSQHPRSKAIFAELYDDSQKPKYDLTDKNFAATGVCKMKHAPCLLLHDCPFCTKSHSPFLFDCKQWPRSNPPLPPI